MIDAKKLAVGTASATMQVAVAPRHTVMAGNPPRTCGAGTLLTLPVAEAQHLIAAGFLFNPQAELDRLGSGAVFRKAR